MNKSPNPHEILLVYIHFKHYMNKMCFDHQHSLVYVYIYTYVGRYVSGFWRPYRQAVSLCF